MVIGEGTKVMTCIVGLDGKGPLNETMRLSNDGRRAIKYDDSRSRGDSELPRGEVLRLALMSSENLAAAALGRNYPGGLPAFVARMNAKARALGMKNTHFVDSSGLSGKNVSTAEEFAKLV